MRNKTLLVLGVLTMTLGLSCPVRAASNTVDYYLTTPEQFKNMMVNLDVKGVRPVEFKSPIPDLAFFHMTTWDKQKNRPGGHIMLVAPASLATTIMKKYGNDMRRGGDIDRMRGILMLSPGGPGPEKQGANAESNPPQGPPRHGPRHAQMWMIDYEGRSAAIMEAHKAEMEKLHKLQQDNPPPENEKQ